MQDRTIDGRLYEDSAGRVWLVGRRDRPDYPAQAINVDTGLLVVYEEHNVSRWLEFKLTSVLRWLDRASPTS